MIQASAFNPPRLAAEQARELVRGEFVKTVVVAWSDLREVGGRRGSADGPTGEARVTEAIDAIDAALVKLGARKGDRADAARDYLTGERKRLVAALDAWSSIGERLDGYAYVNVETAVTGAFMRLQAAERALDMCADMAALPGLQSARDAARVERNAAVRAKDALLASARLPKLPAYAEQLNNAEQLCRDLRGAEPSMSRLHRALDQGRDVAPDVAKLLVIFESGIPTELIDARWDRYCEAHPNARGQAA